jgi:hypothetical protein
MAKKIKQLGVDYFHSHPTIETVKGIDKNHVIVDREEYLEVLDFLRASRIKVEYIVNRKIIFD